ncbi:hypothetical protein BHM03_00031918 [Ensete ventricosum]|nr:hypothetical protein BHM03_00031918 [Ensete ventricosum]
MRSKHHRWRATAGKSSLAGERRLISKGSSYGHVGARWPVSSSLTDMTHNDMTITSSFLRIIGPPTWMTQYGELVGRRYGGASSHAVDLAQVRPIPSPVDASLTARTASVVEAYDDRVSHKGNRVARYE